MSKKQSTAPQQSEASNIIQTMVVRPARIESADIDIWREAVNAAKRGHRQKLYNLYENLMADPVLSDATDKRVNAITNAEIVFMRNGKNVEEIDSLIDSLEFEELIREILLHKAWGKSVIDISFTPEFSVFSVPRKNIRIDKMDRPLAERRRYILAHEYEITGYDYENDDHIIECGKDDDLGFLFKAAPYVIYKRGGFGDWAQFAEIFGMPFLIGKYNSMDERNRDKLFESLEMIGSNPKAAIPKETDLEVHANNSNGSNTLYKDLKDACNEEILISIVGNLMTTLDGSSRSQSETHQKTQEGITKADRRYVQRILNSKLVPLLVKRGYPVAGGIFAFPDQGESITTEDRLNMAIRLKKEADVPVDDDYFYEITGVPKATKKADPKPKKTKKEPEPKNPEPEEKKGLRDFFAQAPQDGAKPNLNLWSKLRHFLTGKIELSDKYAISFDAIFNQALKEIYGGNTATVNHSLFDITNNALQHAFSVEFDKEGADWGVENTAFIANYRKNGAIFAAYKAHTLTKAFVEKVYDTDGTQRTFKQFKKECAPVKEQDERHLPTQYNTAQRATRAAINFKSYLANERLYPNLEYLESLAEHKDINHLVYVGTILPIRHKWWEQHLPPTRWNCQCRVKPTNKKVTAIPADEAPVDPVFANNPALTAKFINTEETPYYKNTDETLRTEIEQLAKRAEKIRQQLEQIEFLQKKFKSGGYIDIPAEGQNKKEEKNNINTYSVLAKKYGGKYALLPVSNKAGVKNPDAANLENYRFSDAKMPNSKSVKNAIQNSIKEASKQKVYEVVIALNSQAGYKQIKDGLKAAFQKGRAKAVKSVIIILKDKSIKRYNADKLRKLFK